MSWKGFQARHGLVADGDPGPKTLAAVEALERRLRGTVHTFGGREIRKGVSRDPALLLPGFADKVQMLFDLLIAHGHNPLLWEGYRSPERAAKLQKKGTGILESMHCLGAAVDIVDADAMWTAAPEFWDAITEGAAQLGLHTLQKNGKPFDRPHVQAVAVGQQKLFRAMTEEQRRGFVT